MSTDHTQPASYPQLVFAGGGTGGHIVPALAIAEQAGLLCPGVGIRVICSTRPGDAELLSGEGVAFTPIGACPPGANPKQAARFVVAWRPAVRAARKILREHAELGPTTLVSMGGFVSAPAVWAARSMGIPVVLVNLDAVPGRANRMTARRSARVYSACDAAEGAAAMDWERVGPIVRAGVSAIGDASDAARAQARRAFGLNPDERTLLVTGGSQGAGSINGLLFALLAEHPEAFAGWQVIHQVGRQCEPTEALARYESAGVRAWTGGFIRGTPGMPEAWASASLSIGRCGAGTVAEAWATRTPSVFFPYPYHSDDHQRANAQALVRAGSAVVLDDRIDPIDNLAQHGSVLLGLLQDPARLSALSEPARRLPPVDGSARVARGLLG